LSEHLLEGLGGQGGPRDGVCDGFNRISGFNRCVSYREGGFNTYGPGDGVCDGGEDPVQNRCVGLIQHRISGFNRCVSYNIGCGVGFNRCVSYNGVGFK
jgi:hypothetical protein